MKMRFLFIITLFLTFSVRAQYQDTVFSPYVKSIKIFLNDDQLAYPVLRLNSGDYIQVKFDIIGQNPADLQYSFVHCNWDWSDEDLFPNEYIDGYFENNILTYNQSFNTNLAYINYTITFPNENVRFLVSGNYLLKVFLASDPDSVLFQKRFFVVEDQVPIQADVHKSTVAQLRLTHQEVDFSIDLTGQNLINPWDYIKASIYQNFRFDMVRYLPQPKFYQGNQMIYDYEYENLFPGGNEFRTFNSSQFKYQSGKIYKFAYVDTIYFCYLLPDNIQYAHASYADANGNYVIYAKPADNIWTEADYTYINFALLADEPFVNGDVYVFGALSNWKIRDEFKLIYDKALKAYTGNVLLKQGIYDYQYVFVPDDSKKPTVQVTEGNFYQTLNDYLILIYYQEQAPYYDRIIGYKLVNMKY